MTSQATAPALVRTTTHQYRTCGNGCPQSGSDSTCSSCDTEIPVLIYTFSNRLPGDPCYEGIFDPTALNLLALARIDYEGSYRSLPRQNEDGTSSGPYSFCSVINFKVLGHIVSVIIQRYGENTFQQTPSQSNEHEERLLEYVGVAQKVLSSRGHGIIPTGPQPTIATTRNLDEIEPIQEESPSLTLQQHKDTILEEIHRRVEEFHTLANAESFSPSSASDECCVCLEEDDMTSLPCCDQPICVGCFQSLLKKDTRCPMCREVVVDGVWYYNISIFSRLLRLFRNYQKRMVDFERHKSSVGLD